ncbi:MAG: flagellar motor protein [Thermodesulfovibrionales bacterium]|nr:flagellar motor protein [Thermodesulfovibrionales bacterium]
MSRSSIIGLLMGCIAIIGGNMMEGGRIESIIQPTAAVIVFGGTFGATLLSFPMKDIIKAIKALKEVFGKESIDHEEYIKELLRYSVITRKSGLVGLEQEINRQEDPFIRRALRLAVDGAQPEALREILNQENITYSEEKKRIARVFETAGGFAPTIGIIGAVLGLIHVMENLADPSKLGAGIAVAFVATVYGVGSANLILLPISKKIINNLHSKLFLREMIIEGIMGIKQGMNPYYLEQKLRAFIEDRKDGR